MLMFLCDDLRELFVAQRPQPLIDRALMAASDGAVCSSMPELASTGGNVRLQRFCRLRFGCPLIGETAGFLLNNRALCCSAPNELSCVARPGRNDSNVVFFAACHVGSSLICLRNSVSRTFRRFGRRPVAVLLYKALRQAAGQADKLLA